MQGPVAKLALTAENIIKLSTLYSEFARALEDYNQASRTLTTKENRKHETERAYRNMLAQLAGSDCGDNIAFIEALLTHVSGGPAAHIKKVETD